MPDTPLFLVRPPFRCFQPVEGRPGRVCGELADWSAPADSADRQGFYCTEHSRKGDQQAATDARFRRVSITLEVLLAGTSLDDATAREEALSRVELALERIGGLVNLHASHSQIGHWKRSAPLRASIAAGGGHRG